MEVQTNSAVIMNLGKQVEDTSGSVAAVKAQANGATPIEARGQQWRMAFDSGNGFNTLTTMPNENTEANFSTIDFL
jgi:hypothetical protein